MAVPAVAFPNLASVWPLNSEDNQEEVGLGVCGPPDDAGWLLASAQAEADGLSHEIQKLSCHIVESSPRHPKVISQQRPASDAAAENKRPSSDLRARQAERIYRTVEKEFGRLKSDQENLVQAGAAERFARNQVEQEHDETLRALRLERKELKAARSAQEAERGAREEAEEARQVAEDSLGRLGIELMKIKAQEAAMAQEPARRACAHAEEAAAERNSFRQEELVCCRLREEFANLRTAMRKERRSSEEAEARCQRAFGEAAQLSQERLRYEEAAEDQLQDSSERQRRQNALERDSRQLRDRLTAIQAAHDASKDEAKCLRTHLERAKEKSRDLASQRDVERETAVRCQREVKRSAELLAQAVSSKAEAVEALEHQLASHEGEEDELRLRLARLEAEREEAIACSAELGEAEVAAQEQSGRYLLEIREAKQELCSLRTDCMRKDEAFRSASDELEEVQKAAGIRQQSAVAEGRALLERLEASERDAKDCNELQRRLTSENHELRSSLDAERNTRATAERLVADLTQERDGLDTEMEQERKKVRQLQAAQHRAALLEEERSTLGSDLEAERFALRELRRVKDDLEAKLADAEDQEKDLRCQQRSLQQQHQELQRDKEQQGLVLQDELQHLRKQLQELQKVQSRNQQLEEELQREREQHHQQLQEERQQHSQQLHRFQAEQQKKAAELSDVMHRHNLQVQGLEERAASADIAASHARDEVERAREVWAADKQALTEELVRRTSFAEQLREQLAGLHSHVAASSTRTAASKAAQEKEPRRHSQRHGAIEQPNRNSGSVGIEQLDWSSGGVGAEQLDKNSGDAKAWRIDEEELQQQLDEVMLHLRQGEETKQQERDAFKSKLVVEQTKVDMQRHLEAKRSVQQELQQHAGQELDKLQHQLKEMQSQLKAERHSQQELQEHCAELQRQIEHIQTQLEAERESRQQESEKLGSQLADLQSQLEAERRTQQELKQRHSAQESEDLQHQLADMQGQLEDMQEALEQERVGAKQLRLRLDLPAEKAAAETKLRNMRRRLAAARGEEVEESDDGEQDVPDTSGSLIDRVTTLEAARDELAMSLEKERKSAHALRAQLDRVLDQRSSNQLTVSSDQTQSRRGRDFSDDFEDEPTMLYESTDPEEEWSAATHEAPRFSRFHADNGRLSSLPRRPFLQATRSTRSLSSTTETETRLPTQQSDVPRLAGVTMMSDVPRLAGETLMRSARRARDWLGEPVQETHNALAMQLVLGALTGSLDERVEAPECCPRCGNIFMPDAKFCRRCGQERCPT